MAISSPPIGPVPSRSQFAIWSLLVGLFIAGSYFLIIFSSSLSTWIFPIAIFLMAPISKTLNKLCPYRNSSKKQISKTLRISLLIVVIAVVIYFWCAAYSIVPGFELFKHILLNPCLWILYWLWIIQDQWKAHYRESSIC